MTIPQLTAVPTRRRYPRFAVLLLSLLCATQTRGDQDFIVGVTTNVLDHGGPLAEPPRLYELDNDWASQPNGIEAYVQRVKDSAAQLRRDDPLAKILAGALGSDALDQGVAKQLIEAGLLNSVDGLSIRPFVACRTALGVYTPESWIRWLDEVEKRLTAQAGHPVPLYLTAMGWPSSQDNCGVSENTQAAFLARSFLLARSRPDIKGMWWYEQADGNVPQHPQHLGLSHSDRSEKPASDVLKVIAPLVTRYRYSADSNLSANTHSPLGRNNLYLMDFTTDDDHVLVAWAIGQARQIRVETRNDVQGPVQLIDTRQPRRGRFDSDSRWVCQEHRCTAVITLSEFPQIISLGKPSWLFTR